MYKIFTYSISIVDHNNLVLTPKVSYLQVRSVYTLDSQNNKIDVIGQPLILEGIYNKIGINYKTITSTTLYLDIQVSDDSLLLSDILDVKVTNTSYTTRGLYTSETYSVVAGKYIQPIIEFSPLKDIYVDCSIDLKFFDKYGNIRLQDIVPIIANDDGLIASELTPTGGQSTALPLALNSVDDIDIYVQNVKLDKSNYSLTSPKVLSFDSRNIGPYIILYRPAFYSVSGYTKISDFLSINRNNIINHGLKDISRVEYKYMVNVFNFNTSSIDETIVIKKLGIVTY